MTRGLLVAVTVMALSASAADATIVNVRIDGTLLSGQNDGVFGGVTNLQNLPFSMQMTFDTTLGMDVSSPTRTTYLGGAANGIPQLPLYTNGSMTINNVTRSLNLWHASIVNAGTGDWYLHMNTDLSPGLANYKRLSVPFESPALVADVTQSFSGLAVTGYGAFDWNIAGIGTASGALFGGTMQVSTGAIVVPEPASWTLLIAGFGLTGAAMRRRARMLATA